jgi:hypothetical protein
VRGQRGGSVRDWKRQRSGGWRDERDDFIAAPQWQGQQSQDLHPDAPFVWSSRIEGLRSPGRF